MVKYNTTQPGACEPKVNHIDCTKITQQPYIGISLEYNYIIFNFFFAAECRWVIFIAAPDVCECVCLFFFFLPFCCCCCSIFVSATVQSLSSQTGGPRLLLNLTM